MKFVLAPDSFKECMSAKEVSMAMREAVLRVVPHAEIEVIPVADGGEGTLEVLTYATNGVIFQKEVTGPLGDKVNARYSLLGDKKTAVVEMAEASGLHHVPLAKRNPLLTTTYGTGELIKAVLDHGISHLIVTLGGSATNDCGVGMLQALGVSVTDREGAEIGFGGGALAAAVAIDFSRLDERLTKITLSIACDVTNPLTGAKGASAIFGPQKGATSEMVKQLDTNFQAFSELLEKEISFPVKNVPGAGAAGGLGAALLACGGKLKVGIDLVLDTLNFDEKIVNADVIYTGEGKIDNQTPDGKVIAGIVKRAKRVNIPVVAFAGAVKTGFEPLYYEGLLAAHSITQGPCTLEEALENGKMNLLQTVENITRVFAGGTINEHSHRS
ncbi:glycerate kinase [Rhodococcus qingshengii]|nr:glycerate kinase [Rhodococcus qingshengii]